jgi:hypothetical protein
MSRVALLRVVLLRFFVARVILVLVALACLIVVGCGNGFEVARLQTPATATAGGLGATVAQVQLSNEIADDGLTADTAVVAELTLTNQGTTPYRLRPSSIRWRMALDPSAPGQTRALASAWAGAGAFSDESSDGGYHLKFEPLSLAPGETRSYWVVFPAYRFEGNDVPRVTTLSLPAPDGGPLNLVLADPTRGLGRWQVEPVSQTWRIGVQNHSLFGPRLRAVAVATTISHTWRIGPVTLDAGFVSRLLVQLEGTLVSPTSAFTGFGVQAHLSAPLIAGGTPESPRQLGLFVGGEASNLISIQRDQSLPPHLYGVLGVEGGLELGFGAIRRAPTPFPLQDQGRPLPRLVTRLGYTHWWLDGGSASGYMTSAELAW